MEQSKITVVIPTYNREECINYIVENCLKNYNGELFCFEIHDSSESNSSQEIIQKFNKNSQKKVSYFRYDSKINGDSKTLSALKNVKTKYAYLIGDGMAVNYNDLEKSLIESNFLMYDLIGVFPQSGGFKHNKYNKKKYSNDNYIYLEEDKECLFINHLVGFTLYGASIVKKYVLDYILDNNIIEKYKYQNKYSYAYCFSLFETTFNLNLNVGVSYMSSVYNNPMKKGNWANGEKFYEIFYKEFLFDIDKVLYDKKTVDLALKNIAKYHFTYYNIVNYKFKNVFTLKLLKKYRNEIKRINNHYWFMWFVALTPNWLLKIYVIFIRKIRRFLGGKK